LNDDVWLHCDGSYAGVIKIIKDGIEGTPMARWEGRLGMERVRMVAAYVLSLSKKK
jgi:hypothetical protein